MISFATDVSPIVIDVETAPLANARDYIDPPDLDDVQAPSNYKDPAKITAYIEEAKADRLAKFERDCTDKAALDFNCARIVAVGFWTESHKPTALLCKDETDERAALDEVWEYCQHRTTVGFRIREFDLPLMIQRSRYLRLTHPLPDLGRYARGNAIADLYDLLTFNDLRAEAVMRRSLKSFARRFGIPVDDTVDGKAIPALVAAGAWDQVEAHVLSDIRVTLALAQRLGVVRNVPAVDLVSPEERRQTHVSA
jgi:hypothetical protein